jgi:hypothetical protein
MTEAKPKRQWFRFSLRALFVLVTAFCVWLGWEVNSARLQKEAVEAIVKAGGMIGYDFQIRPAAVPANLLGKSQPFSASDLGFFAKYGVDQNAIPSAPAWLRDHIGSDFFRNVASVSFPRASTVEPMTDIEHLAKLPTLRQFYLVGGYPNKVGYPNQSVDFTALADLKYLEGLTIWNFRVDGPVLAKFHSLPRLTHVSLCNTGFDDAAMEQVGRMSNLECLWLHHTHVTDAGIAHVERLTKLKLLYLDEAEISDSGLKHLAGLNQ